MSATLDKVRDILAAKAEVPPAALQPDTRLEDLGIDSLGMTEVLFELEEAFDIVIPDSEESADRFGGLATVAGVATLVDRLR